MAAACASLERLSPSAFSGIIFARRNTVNRHSLAKKVLPLRLRSRAAAGTLRQHAAAEFLATANNMRQPP